MAPQKARRRGVVADDLYRLRFVGDPQISPDGSLVTYVVSWVDPADHTRYRSQLMLADFDASKPPRALTSGLHRDSAPRWSPDGGSLAFLSDRVDAKSQLFVLPLQGGEPRQLTSLKRGAGVPVWSPTGDRIAFSARVDIEAIARQEGQSDDKAKPPRVKLITRIRHKGDGEGFFEALRKHLFVLDASRQKEPLQITDGDWDDAEPTWSPDGKLVAFTSNRERDRDTSLLTDVWAVPSAGGRARRLTRHRGQASVPVFSPDGREVAYLGHERGWTYGARTELRAVPVEGGDSRPIAGDFDAELGNAALSDARDPFAAQPPAWDASGRSLLNLVSRNGRVEVVRFDAAGQAPPAVVLGGDREICAFSVARDGQHLACVVSDPTHPYEVVAATANGAERRVSHENDALLDTLEVTCAEPFQVSSTDGQVVHGWLMKPPGSASKKKLPLILEVHGGPETMYAATFMHEFQALAARGYAVLYTNPRGSKGYGEAFTSRIFADWGNQDAADCMAAVDAACQWKWVDTSRVGLTGGSYGGFMTAWLVGHTNRFRAAVSQRGCYNFASFYGTSDIGPWFGDYILGGPVYEREALYRERSPLTYARDMRTPLLLIHSEQDLRCPIEQAEQLFVQLRRIGKVEVEMVRFPEESHNLSRSGRPDRRIERLERIYGWFDAHM
ncbi:MAG TPA: S9 family peptidase [Chloroflexota bacterium]|nr:S9 family peptidase [Chloroflexota bacterium]